MHAPAPGPAADGRRRAGPASTWREAPRRRCRRKPRGDGASSGLASPRARSSPPRPRPAVSRRSGRRRPHCATVLEEAPLRFVSESLPELQRPCGAAAAPADCPSPTATPRRGRPSLRRRPPRAPPPWRRRPSYRLQARTTATGAPKGSAPRPRTRGRRARRGRTWRPWRPGAACGPGSSPASPPIARWAPLGGGRLACRRPRRRRTCAGAPAPWTTPRRGERAQPRFPGSPSTRRCPVAASSARHASPKASSAARRPDTGGLRPDCNKPSTTARPPRRSRCHARRPTACTPARPERGLRRAAPRDRLASSAPRTWRAAPLRGPGPHHPEPTPIPSPRCAAGLAARSRPSMGPRP
mmetsp:Transcript_45728/g.131889  ORF Transcript_45728/g.131889 Transcript_45728/m.131889 type:complete len:355 (+) Transcript_45728:929-1993(+)